MPLFPLGFRSVHVCRSKRHPSYSRQFPCHGLTFVTVSAVWVFAWSLSGVTVSIGQGTSLHHDPLTARKTDVQIISPHRPTSLTSISRKILKRLIEPGHCARSKPIWCQTCEGCFRFSMMSWVKGIHQTAFFSV